MKWCFFHDRYNEFSDIEHNPRWRTHLDREREALSSFCSPSPFFLFPLFKRTMAAFLKFYQRFKFFESTIKESKINIRLWLEIWNTTEKLSHFNFLAGNNTPWSAYSHTDFRCSIPQLPAICHTSSHAIAQCTVSLDENSLTFLKRRKLFCHQKLCSFSLQCCNRLKN